MPYMHIGKTVYKKNPNGSRGKKVGTAKGSVKKYLAALYMHSGDTNWTSLGKRAMKRRRK